MFAHAPAAHAHRIASCATHRTRQIRRGSRETRAAASAPETPRAWADKSIAIIGAGPSGLATALALRKYGITNVKVFDRVSELRPNIGGGFNLNGGARVLCELGLEDVYASLANDLLGVRARRVEGQQLFEVKVHEMISADVDGREALVSENGRVLCGTVQRADLQRAMASALPDDVIMLNRGVKSVRTGVNGTKSSITFEDDAVESFDLVIGADGIDSQARVAVDGGASPPKYSGIRIVFGCTPAGSDARPASEMNTAHQWFADGMYMLCFTGGGDRKEAKQHNIAVCVRDETRRDENTAWRAKPAAKDETLSLLRSKGVPQSAITVAESCDRFFDVGVHYHDVLERWSDADGSVTLVGDACHAMPPFLGQGANQAMQDALCVASCLSKVGSTYATTADALQAYENIRKPPTAAIMQSSRFVGALETGAGPVSLFRDVAFIIAGTLGITGKVFLTGAMPRFEA
jgi:salicylate hydroxylase